MNPIDIPAIEEKARELRAAEIQRMNSLFAEHAKLMTQLAADSIVVSAAAASELLRPLFSWNPQEKPLVASHPGLLLEQMNKAAFKLFSWNPQDRCSA